MKYVYLLYKGTYSGGFNDSWGYELIKVFSSREKLDIWLNKNYPKRDSYEFRIEKTKVE